MALHVGKPGLLSTLQDLGRYGSQKYGVIASGAMDAFAHTSANILVGNPEPEATLEMTVIGPELLFDSDTLISICGADMFPAINGISVPMWRPVVIRAGERLLFGASRIGCRSYLAISGGFDVPLEMSSYSTYLRAGIGGLGGRALKAGDKLSGKTPSSFGRQIMSKLFSISDQGAFAAVPWFISNHIKPLYDSNPTVRVIEGPQFNWFDQESISSFVSKPFRIQPQSDRMGYRIEGPPLTLTDQRELLSEAVTFGTVQVPPDGNPIVLMADRQTTGGYPKIAQVVSVDLPLLAQSQIGSWISFQWISLREAQEMKLMLSMDLDLLKKSVQMQCV
jgi:antagonist of KipI